MRCVTHVIGHGKILLSSLSDKQLRTLRKVLGRVGDVCVKGVATWEPAWMHARKATDAFDLAFDAWVAKDTKASRKKLVETSDEFVAAWGRASDMYEDTQAEGF